jgi:endonuclease/exonuclease/phosphatase family metal-dependent hydrolase
VLLLVSCERPLPFQPDTRSLSGITADPAVVVMSRNLYLGANIDALLAPDADIPAALEAALMQVQRTDFSVRAKALAQEIHAAQPHLVGLQEVTSYAVTLADGTVIPVFGFPLDFLTALQAELAALGDAYVVANRVQHAMYSFPLGDLAPVPGLYINYSDADAILARGDVNTGNAGGGHYEHQLVVQLAGMTFENLRGWVQVDAEVDGVAFRFATTHLEVQLFADVQEAQAAELINILSDSPLPVVLVGDFNSAANHDAPEQSRTGSYQLLRNAGYKDLWVREPHSVDGLTCCHADDLSNTFPNFNQRLDLVLVRWGEAGFGGRSQVTLVGDRPDDLFTHPLGYTLWPSDHAGIAAWIWPAPGRRVAD